MVITGLRHDNVLHLAIVLGARLQRKPVPGTHGDHEILFVENLFCEPGWHVVDGNRRDVDSASLKIGENRLPGVLERSPARARREKLTKADVNARSAMPHLGEQAWQEHRRHGIRRANGEATGGRSRLERPAGRDEALDALKNFRDRPGRCALSRDHAFRDSEKQRIVKQPPEAGSDCD